MLIEAAFAFQWCRSDLLSRSEHLRSRRVFRLLLRARSKGARLMSSESDSHTVVDRSHLKIEDLRAVRFHSMERWISPADSSRTTNVGGSGRPGETGDQLTCFKENL